MKYIKENIEWAKSFLSESYVNGVAGKASSRRVMELAVVWTFIFSYVKVTLFSQAFAPLDWTWAVMIGGILGLKSLNMLAEKAKGGANGTTTGS